MYQLHKFNEVVFSVGNLAEAERIYTELLGWKVLWRGQGHASQCQFWGLPQAQTDEVLLGFDDLDFGQIRLVKFHNVAQKFIRSGGQTWDSGGIMDIDLRVGDIQHTYDLLRENGFHGHSDPILQQMGPFTINEVVMKGHDEIAFALVNRIEPPLPNPSGRKGCISNVYLSALVVKDIAVSRDFFVNKLGFLLLNQVPFPLQNGPNMFGFPESMAGQVTAKLEIIAPTESRDSMFDLIEFEGVSGRDFSEFACPPNRGILLYRLPVRNIDAYADFITQNGVEFKVPPAVVDYQPIGQVKMFAVQSPDGVWLEFWERV